MSQPKKWFVGLLPIVAVLAIAGVSRQGAMESDLAQRGGASLRESGMAWAQVKMAGRDAVITGESPDPGLRGEAIAAVDRAFGVRLVKDQMTVMPEAKPYVLSAVRDGARVVLTGFAPNATIKAAIAEAAKKAMPDATIVDELKLARGAPANLNAASNFGFGELAKLSQGTLAISDAALSLTGRAIDLPKWNDVRTKLAALPAGSTLGKGLGAADILPPLQRPYTVGAEKSASGITLTGFVPSENMRQTVLAAANTLGRPVTDRMQIGDGAPASYANNLDFGFARLAQLETGQFSFTDSAFTITGRAASPQSFTDVRSRLAGLPQGMTLARQEIQLPIVKPYTFEAEKSRSGIVLTGYIPSEGARGVLVAAANASGPPVTDRLQVADGVPAGNFADTVTRLIVELGQLQSGKATLVDTRATISGLGHTGVTEDVVRGNLRSLPQGFQLVSAQIEAGVIRPYLFNATRGDNVLTLSGHVPDQATRTAINDQARRFFEGDRINDALQIGPGAPQGFLNAVRGGMQDLSRLLPGSSFAMSDQNVSLKGLAFHDGARDQIIGEFRTRIPAGFGSLAEINTAPLPPSISQAPECQILFNDVLSRGRILFDTGSADLAVESTSMLDRLVVVARRCSEARFEVSGHTDSDGAVAMNNDLSRRRAETVAQFLVRAGITAERLEAVGYGPSRPVAANDTAENKAKNRRIEFTVK